MGRIKKDYIGKTYGKLTLIKELDSKVYKYTKCPTIVRIFLCNCACGNTTSVGLPSLTSGNTTSCGCYNKEIASQKNRTHGYSSKNMSIINRDTYKIWASMKNRCNNSTCKTYKYYGGKGVTYSSKWEIFEGFLEDMGPKPFDNYSLDRIEPSGNYCKENCRWTDFDTQSKNKRDIKVVNFKGKSYLISELANKVGIKPRTLYSRIFEYGWSVEESVQPIDKRGKKKGKMSTVLESKQNILLEYIEKLSEEKINEKSNENLSRKEWFILGFKEGLKYRSKN